MSDSTWCITECWQESHLLSPLTPWLLCHVAFRLNLLGAGSLCTVLRSTSWSIACGCSGREFTTKTSCRLLCVIRFLWIHVQDSGLEDSDLPVWNILQKMWVRGTQTHQHPLSYHIKGCLILKTMYLIFHLHRLFWNTVYFCFESPLMCILTLLEEQTEAFYFCLSVRRVPMSVQYPSSMDIKTSADNIRSSPVLWNSPQCWVFLTVLHSRGHKISSAGKGLDSVWK